MNNQSSPLITPDQSPKMSPDVSPDTSPLSSPRMSPSPESDETNEQVFPNEEIVLPLPEGDEAASLRGSKIEDPNRPKGFSYDAYSESNPLSKLFLGWCQYILRMAKKTEINADDLGPLADENNANSYSNNLAYFWEERDYKSIKSNALAKTVFRANVGRLIGIFILYLTSSACEYFLVILIKELIDHFERKENSRWPDFPVYQIGIAYIVTQIINLFTSVHASMKESVFSKRASSELSCFIYHKILVVSPSSFESRATEGEIINFNQIDALKLYYMIQRAPNTLIIPIMIVAYIYLLFDFFSYAFLAGIGVMIIVLIANYHIFKGYRKVSKEILVAKDERMKATTETFDNIKILKLYNWENDFKQKIFEKREAELACQRRSFNLSTTNISLFWFCPVAVSIATIGVYQYLHSQFTIGTMLIGLTIFSRLQEPIRSLPNSINSILEMIVSMKRIESFIRQPERKHDNIIHDQDEKKNEYDIKIEHGNFTWGSKKKKEDEEKDKNKKKKKKNKKKEEKKTEKKTENKSEKKKDYGKLIDEIIKDDPNVKEPLIPRDSVVKEQVEEEEKKEDEGPLIEEEKKEEKKEDEGPLIEDEHSEENDNLRANNIDENSIEEIDTSKSEKEKKQKEEKVVSLPEGVPEDKNQYVDASLDIPEDCDFDVVLKDISFTVKRGEIIGIIGEVGSGKSSLIQAILNNLIILNPSKCDGIHINGSIGYVSQIPWIQNATIRDNILFFNKYNPRKYNKVLKVSQLKYDLNNFEGKDMTEIGEKGVNLSGGQKVRVAFARALYADPDIYLFDDPISALDANIGQKIMKDCIVKYLKGKTRIVATHALHYLKYMDRIYYLEKGRIIWKGKYEDLRHQKFFSNFHKLSHSTERKKSEAEEVKEEETHDHKEGKEVKIIAKEDREEGTVKMGVYFQYFIYMGGICFISMIVLVMFLWQVNKGGSDVWLAFWSLPINQEVDDPKKKWIFFSIYSALGLASALFIFIRIYLLTIGSIRLSRKLHIDMINKLVKAPINLYHETIPRGQIYNRLSKDLESLQWTIYMVGNFLVGAFSVIGSLVVCSIYDYYSLSFAPFLGIVGYFLTVFYLTGSRQLSRLEGIARSPILNTISETLPGNDSILAFQKTQAYLHKFYDNINDSFKVNVFLQGVYAWFTLQFNFLSLLFLIYLVVMTTVFEDSYTSQAVAMMFSYSIILQNNLSYSFISCADLETTMISMERCLSFTEIVQEKESVAEKDEELRKQNWPQKGAIRFENYFVKYRPTTETVLKNVSFSVRPREKVGIVGRTGSGKSTICLCLFRLLEPESGTIYIDDVDITTVGLDILRKNLTIIPQDPCLMAGTLKYNIDPLGLSTEEEILHVLDEIGLNFEKGKDEKPLDKMIELNGANLSVGEKQLVCIARAILRKTKIIVMDEATANIDMVTEEKIQNALGKLMDHVTTITIAHRIKTIINYDKILVLDNGEVAEFDSPDALLSNKDSLFYQLYTKSII